MTDTNNLIRELYNLKKDKDMSKTTTENNRTVCRMINVQLREFFDDIYLHIDLFRKAGWKINKVLYNNEDALYFNDKYLADEDHARFHEVFDKYVAMLEEILSTDNRLFTFLEKWTDTSMAKWKSNNIGIRSYLKSIIAGREYQIISPLYVTNYFLELKQKYNDDNDKIKEKLETHLNEICENFQIERRNFKKIYNSIIESYVYDYPTKKNDPVVIETYILGFINSVILAILDFAEKLIDLNIYAIHPLVNEVIYYYTPIDEINLYNPSEYGGRKLIIV